MKVLLIENDAPVMRLTAWALAQEAFDVTAISPREAFQQPITDPPDLVIFNLSATSEDKRQYNHHLRMLYPECVVVDVDQFGPGGRSIRDSDADFYVVRPLSLEDLVTAVHAIAANNEAPRT